MKSRLAGLVAVLAVGATAVSGCSIAGTDFRPGVAAEVGNATVRVIDVDGAVDGVCDYLDDLPDSQPQPRAGLRTQFVQTLLEKEAMTQLLDEQGVSLPREYQQTIGQAKAQSDGLPQAQADAVDSINEAGIYVRTGEAALGRSQGRTDDTAAINAGAELLLAWIKDHGVDVNPVFGFSVADVSIQQQVVNPQSGQTVPILSYPPTDDSSLAVSDGAKFALQPEAGAAPDPDADTKRQAYIDSLPASQTCG